MAAEILKGYLEHLPALRLIGLRYTDADRGEGGGFGACWADWWQAGRFAPLDALPHVPVEGDAYVGAMRRVGDVFEYWIGMLCTAGTPCPDGYGSVDLDASDLYTVWLHGREDTGELYGQRPKDLIAERAAAEGLSPRYDGWCFERYVCPRFLEKDAEGRVILDFCFQVAARA